MSVQAARLVPEPTTATLSLLALAGLASRRRRR
ncbi:MAG: PEP-CTERM sorting domain-containing protein [Akkermansia sp.]|nr:PEP-CTERM sorting domain-containing protein [Akkermansia sp.]